MIEEGLAEKPYMTCAGPLTAPEYFAHNLQIPDRIPKNYSIRPDFILQKNYPWISCGGQNDSRLALFH
jgi:hypothetical protein